MNPRAAMPAPIITNIICTASILNDFRDQLDDNWRVIIIYSPYQAQVKDLVHHNNGKWGPPVHSEAENADSQEAHEGGYQGGVGNTRHAWLAAFSCKIEIRFMTIKSKGQTTKNTVSYDIFFCSSLKWVFQK